MTVASLERVSLQHFSQLRGERCQVFRHRIPYLVEIDVEVQMYQAVSHGDYLRLRNLRVFIFGFLSHACSRFADNFNAFDQAQGPNVVTFEVFACTS
jgi:hypothetical protein